MDNNYNNQNNGNNNFNQPDNYSQPNGYYNQNTGNNNYNQSNNYSQSNGYNNQHTYINFDQNMAIRCENCGSYNVSKQLEAPQTGCNSCAIGCVSGCLTLFVIYPILLWFFSLFLNENLANAISFFLMLAIVAGEFYRLFINPDKKVVGICQNCGHRQEINN